MSELSPQSNTPYSELTAAHEIEPQRIYLEIGPFDEPTAAESSRSFTGPNVYIGLELNAGDHYDPDMFERQRRSIGKRVADEQIILAQGDGRNMILPDNSVHEVYLGNVIPVIPHEDVVLMLQDIHRVMDGSGEVVMDTGDAVDEYFDDEFHRDLVAQGFTIEGTYDEYGPESARWQELRDAWPSIRPGPHIFTVARKNAEQGDAATASEATETDGAEHTFRVDSPREYIVDPHEMGVDYGVPEEILSDVAADLLHTLQLRGIGLESVVFSGYHGDDATPDATKGEDQAVAYTEYFELSEYDVISDLPEYHFATKAALDTSADSSGNPIHFAGTGPNATIAVYDAEVLATLDSATDDLELTNPEQFIEMGWVRVRATAAQIEQAKLMEFHPRYRPSS